MPYDAPAIALEGAHLYVGERLLLPDVNLSVPEGSHVVINGASGSGKSTLLRVLAGFPPPEKGQLLINGSVVTPTNRNLLRRRIAYVPQTPQLTQGVTVMEYLKEPLSYRSNSGTSFSDRHIEAKAEALRLPPSLLLQTTDQLSGGERHRLMLLRGILLNRRIFLLDELSGSLDAASRSAALASLDAGGATVVSVSHDENWLARSDYRYEIRAARLEAVSLESVVS